MSTRSAFGQSARVSVIATLAAAVCLTPLSAAVIPLGFDKTEAGGPGASLPGPSLLTAMSGQWIGHDAGGRDVKLDLHVSGGAIAGSATLVGVVPEAASRQWPVAQVALAGRTLVFSVHPTPCDRKATYAVLTIVSPASARLDLETSSRPISFTLSKIS